MQKIDKIGIVIVAYNPNIKYFIENIKKCRKQTDFVVVVDNSDQIEKSENLKRNLPDNIIFLGLNGNKGIAKAQNIGIEYCIKNECLYILELDQDSAIPENYLTNLKKSFESILKFEISVAGIGPVILDSQKGKGYYEQLGTKLIEVEKTVSSGFMISSDAFKQIGPKDERLFIDFVDWEWNWRAKAKGYRTFIDTKIAIQHQLSDGYKNFYFFRVFNTSPMRHYYQYRNTLILISINYVPLRWKIRRLFILLAQFFLLILFFNNRASRFKYLIFGVRDFFRNKNGKLNEYY